VEHAQCHPLLPAIQLLLVSWFQEEDSSSFSLWLGLSEGSPLRFADWVLQKLELLGMKML